MTNLSGSHGEKENASCVVQVLLSNIKRSAAKKWIDSLKEKVITTLSKEKSGHIYAGFAHGNVSVIQNNTSLERYMGRV